MNLIRLIPFLLVAAAISAEESEKMGETPPYYFVGYPPSTDPGQCQIGVRFTLWVPPGVKTFRGIIVHQHGCGEGACKGGLTAAYDLHWQALAKKWDCALLGPSYRQAETQNCGLWCDARNGSAKSFLRALRGFAVQTQHPELERVPWCLWGHSGGASWVGHMQVLYPERVIAVWYRSGSPFPLPKEGQPPPPPPEIPEAAFNIPMLCNPGMKEKDDKRFHVAFDGALAMYELFHKHGAPIAVAPDPRTSHQCGDSRYLAIPFFDACLAMRLPDPGTDSQTLKPVDLKNSWTAPLLGDTAQPAAATDHPAMWLPNEAVAKAWMEYVKTGAVGDTTPPPAPTDLKFVSKSTGVELTWSAEADFESGLQAFVIQRDGHDVAQVPEKPVGTFGRPLFQKMSYHDTPERPLPQMRFVDTTAKPGDEHEYRVIAVNGVGLKSAPSAGIKVALAPLP